MALHDPRPEAASERADRAMADNQQTATVPSQADRQAISEPTIRVPVPSPNWVVIVAATDAQVSAIELPIAAFTDPVLMRSLADMKYEMGKHAE